MDRLDNKVPAAAPTARSMDRQAWPLMAAKLLLALLLTRQVWAEPTSTKPINIEADHFEMLLAEHQATYTGSVVAVQGNYEFQADRLTVLFNEDNEVISIHAAGTPAVLSDKMVDPATRVTGARLDYLFEEGAIRVTGDSVLTQGADSLAAELIVYDLDTNRAQAFSVDQERVQLILEPRKE